MSLENIREGGLKGVFDALEKAFAATGVDFYVIGALARNEWYERGGKIARYTNDADFAVMVRSKEEYEKVRAYLEDNENFISTKGNEFVKKFFYEGHGKRNRRDS